jgi:hypothetical protein
MPSQQISLIMKYIGKILLFFSSYLPVWLIWILVSIDNQGFYLNITSGLGILLTIISVLTCVIFILTYETANRYDIKTISINNISNGSSEAISYLLTLIIPLATSTIPFELFGGNFTQNEIVTLILGLAIFFIYLRSNLLVMNPTMMLIGYSFYQINYKMTDESAVTFDGILMTKKSFNLQEIPSQNNVTIVDQDVYLL